MNLAYPDVLWFLFVLVPVILVQYANYRRGRRDLKVLTGAAGRTDIHTIYQVKAFFLALFFDLFIVFAVLALAGFSWGMDTVEEDRSGLELAIVVDVSRSMLAEDVPPSRLARSASVVRGLVRELAGSRFSVVVFKGDAVTVVPMTEDAVAVESVLDFLGTGLISTPGTNLARGLEEALESFPEGSARNRAVLVFSDGESLSGSPYEVVYRAVNRGIPVFTLGAGTVEGTTVFLADGTPIIDDNGNPVVSRLEADVLRVVAAESGGQYLSLSDVNVFSALLGRLRSFEEIRTVRGFRLQPIRRFRLFLALSALFLVLYLALRTVRFRGAL